MKTETTYAGINYAGNLPTNKDTDTGIRYGVISQNDLMPEALDDVLTQGRDLDYENALEQAKHELMLALESDEPKDALRRTLGNYVRDSRIDSHIEEILELNSDPRFIDREAAFEIVSEDFSDSASMGGGDCARMLYESGGYRIQTNSGGDAWCLKSPYFTFAQFCSPCAPGACHLGNPLNLKARFADNRAYCFGHDWFEDSIAPYPVYLVATGELVSHLTPAESAPIS